MSISLEQFERSARTIGDEHRKAIQASEESAKELALAEKDYHRELAVQIALAKHEFGSATMAETMAKGHSDVCEARERREIAAAKDRAAMERVRLARDDRSALISIASWSRSAEAIDNA